MPTTSEMAMKLKSYEDIYSNGRLVSHGDILAVNLQIRRRAICYTFHTKRKKRLLHYRQHNVRRLFLEPNRICPKSHYNPNRKHPILNTIKAHKGTDYLPELELR